MTTYIALFRGINVGGNNLLPMKELKPLLEANGFKDVKTYIQSGNVVFQGDQPRDNEIAELCEAQYGFRPHVITFSASEFRSIAQASPYLSEPGKSSHFYFSESRIVVDANRMDSFKADSEQFTVADNVLYLFAPEGIGRSKLVSNLESCLASPVTGRNLNTVNKLLEMSQT